MQVRATLLAIITLVAAPAAQAQSDAVATVRLLYKDFAWEAVIDDKVGEDLIFGQPRAVLELYFAPALTELLLSDRDCVKRTQEICRLDFSPIWASQDPGADNLTVSATDIPSRVDVRFRYPGAQDETELTYTLAEAAAGWRVTDIQGEGWSLLEILGGEQ